LILEMPIDEASAKIRTGGPLDDEEDYATRYWAGVIPFSHGIGSPIPDGKLPPGIDVPDYLKNYFRRR
jgi:hypothetical protein